MEKQELVYMDAKSSKFWNIELTDTRYTITYGRIGTAGQTSAKEFPTPEKAQSEYAKQVKAKLSKGYVSAEGSGVSSAGDESAEGTDLPFVSFSNIIHSNEIFENAKTFVGRRVTDFDAGKAAKHGSKHIYRIRSDWEEQDFKPELEKFLANDVAPKAVGLIIGAWHGDDSELDSSEAISKLVENKERLPSLAALCIGDITSEENEISWIQQSDLSPLLKAFPNLQLLRARGGNGLAINQASHGKLRALALETGGMDVSVVRSVCTADFPNLEYLELWLGTEEYGGTCSVQDLQPIFSGNLFPKLKYLGLRNCDFADEIAGVIVNSPIIDRIETLDLSLGVLTDEGGQALLSLPQDGCLKRVSLHFHYMSSKMISRLKAMKLSIDLSRPNDMEEDDEWRFVAVGE